VAPVFEQLYTRVVNGDETRRTLECNSTPDYREKLDAELATIHNSEMWRAGAAVRSLRPENRRK
jgi:ketol-acid reductoisomerase